ncbi:MAG TPA: CGGC domain-containing protein [Deltaproteobacteria bacterium]|nr:CGGC domain-containing protein [Deltaproteobacteria bacterium]HOM30183.1 CGGC domain-containing protein [Deltaproteobacteria bacterium]HPP79978.1 CGGC domain-containing protein [Deltaproteobacteria bacterium]
MKKIGIIICDRYRSCGGGKCFRALKERCGGFACYPPGEPVEVVGFSSCGGCPGGNVEYVPAEMKENGAEVIHLATGFVVGYPPCPYTKDHKEFIENHYGLKVVVGTHPIPMKYLRAHERLGFWEREDMKELAGALMDEPPDVMTAYD